MSTILASIEARLEELKAQFSQHSTLAANSSETSKVLNGAVQAYSEVLATVKAALGIVEAVDPAAIPAITAVEAVATTVGEVANAVSNSVSGATQ